MKPVSTNSAGFHFKVVNKQFVSYIMFLADFLNALPWNTRQRACKVVEIRTIMVRFYFLDGLP